MEEFIKSAKTLICVGNGGVGKTTIAASVAVLAAQAGLKTLVLTIDPSQRLKTALGIKEDSNQEYTKVPGQNYKGELYAALIDPQKSFEQYIANAAPDSSRAQKILNNKLFKQLSTSLSGSQEFTSVDALYRAVVSQKFDIVILDTPPAQHAIDFLRSPERIYSLFQKGITKWFSAPKGDQPWWQQIINKGTSSVFAALEKVTGSEFIHELSEFFNVVRDIEDKISNRSIEGHRMLVSPTTQFVLVTSNDESKILEALDFHKDLSQGGYHLGAMIFNRSEPLWDPSEKMRSAVSKEMQPIAELFQKMNVYFAEQEKQFKKTLSRFIGQTQTVRLPEFDQDIYGLESLERIAQALKNKWKSELQLPQ